MADRRELYRPPFWPLPCFFVSAAALSVAGLEALGAAPAPGFTALPIPLVRIPCHDATGADGCSRRTAPKLGLGLLPAAGD